MSRGISHPPLSQNPANYALYGAADYSGLERDWMSEMARAEQALGVLPDHDQFLATLHGQP